MMDDDQPIDIIGFFSFFFRLKESYSVFFWVVDFKGFIFVCPKMSEICPNFDIRSFTASRTLSPSF